MRNGATDAINFLCSRFPLQVLVRIELYFNTTFSNRTPGFPLQSGLGNFLWCNKFPKKNPVPFSETGFSDGMIIILQG